MTEEQYDCPITIHGASAPMPIVSYHLKIRGHNGGHRCCNCSEQLLGGEGVNSSNEEVADVMGIGKC